MGHLRAISNGYGRSICERFASYPVLGRRSEPLADTHSA